METIRRAPEHRIDFLDTSDAYGNGRNEELISQVVEERRNQYVIASKFGNLRRAEGTPTADGRPEYVKAASERGLQPLRTDVIDLYYIHRIDRTVSIEETVGAMGDFARDGKVRFLGISEAGPQTIRGAHATHPMSAVQVEYSLWSREVESEVLDLRNVGPALQWTPRSWHRKGLAVGRVPRLLHPDGGGERALRRGGGLSAQGLDEQDPLFASRRAMAFRGHRRRASANPETTSALMDRRVQPASIRQAAESGCNLLLGQNGSPELVAESIGIYSKAVEAQDRTYDPMTVGLTRALHIAMTEEEREAAHRVRIQFTRNVQQLSLSPAGNSPNLGRPRRAVSEEEMRRATESDALIGTPQEIVERLRRLQAGGVEYVLIIDVGGSLAALRTFAREVMPEFAE